MNKEDFISILKAVEWQKCKGVLYGFLMLLGQNYPEFENGKKIESNFDKLNQLIDTFIDDVQDSGLNE